MHINSQKKEKKKKKKSLNFDRKETKIVHIWFPKIHIILRKELLPPCDHQKSYISVNLEQKGPETLLCIFMQNTKFS